MTALRPGLVTDGPEPALIGGRCAACARFHFPKAQICPYCSADNVEEVELSRTGLLWAWTSVSTAPPGYFGEVPYGFGVVELPEGLRVVTRLTESDTGRLTLGQMMHLEIVPVRVDEGNEALTYAFAPSDEFVAAESAAAEEG